MLSINPGTPIPKTDNLADFFARIWHQFRDDAEALNRAAAAVEKARGEALRCSEHLEGLLVKLGLNALRSLEDWAPTSFDSDGRSLLVAQAIDHWYGKLSPDADVSAPSNPDRARAWRMLIKDGRLNSKLELGRVILRRPRWGRWADPDLCPPSDGDVVSVFSSLFVAPTEIQTTDPDDGEKSGPAVKLSYHIVDYTMMRPDVIGPLSIIGLAPIAEAKDDLTVEFSSDGSRHWYDVKARNLESRARKSIEKLCGEGAHIIIFPEMTMHPDSLTAVRDAVKTYGPSSQLRFVIAGTHRNDENGSRPYNQAVILNHRGEILASQRKLHRWNLDYVQRDRLGFHPPGLQRGDKLFEFITPGDEVIILEQPMFGRLVVMICEDLSRSEPGRWLRANLLLDWIFTPILDRAIAPKRWMDTEGYKAAVHGSCRVVVANSLPLTHLANDVRTSAGIGLLGSCGLGLCVDWEGGVARSRFWEVPMNGSGDWAGVFKDPPGAWKSINIS